MFSLSPRVRKSNQLPIHHITHKLTESFYVVISPPRGIKQSVIQRSVELKHYVKPRTLNAKFRVIRMAQSRLSCSV